MYGKREMFTPLSPPLPFTAICALKLKFYNRTPLFWGHPINCKFSEESIETCHFCIPRDPKREDQNSDLPKFVIIC